MVSRMVLSYAIRIEISQELADFYPRCDFSMTWLYRQWCLDKESHENCLYRLFRFRFK